jgi:hypothetical protein
MNISATTARSIQALEEKLRPNLKWQKIEEMPGFPFQNFAETQKELSANDEYSFWVDFGVARKFSSWMYGRPYALFITVLLIIPALLALFVAVSGVVEGRYVLLICIPAVIVGYIFGSPYALRGKLLIPLALFCVWIWAIWSGHGSVAWIVGLIALPIWIMNGVNSMNLGQAKDVALYSEVIFLELYRDGHIGICNRKTTKIYSYKPAMLKKAFQAMGKKMPDNIEELDWDRNPDDIHSIVPDLDQRLARIRVSRQPAEHKEPTE